MSDNFSDAFTRALLQHLFECPNEVQNAFVVRRNSGDKLAETGDFSFPLEMQSWRHFLRAQHPMAHRTVFGLGCAAPTDRPSEAEEAQFVAEQLDRMRERMANYVDRVLLQQNRVSVFVRRSEAFRTLPDILRAGSAYGRIVRVPGEPVQRVLVRDLVDSPSDDDEMQRLSITDYRCVLLRRVLHNLLGYSRYESAGTDSAFRRPTTLPALCLTVTHKSTLKSLDVDAACGDQPQAVCPHRIIVAGVVKDDQNKKSPMLAAEYLRIRQKHMELMAQHKYGLRIADADAFAALSRTLGWAAFTVDMLEVKHSSPVALSLRQHCGGASRGAAFVLYNSARIEKLVETYDAHRASGHYAASEVDECDLSLLKEEEEWQLMFNYVLEFPNVVRRSLGAVESEAVAPHLICAFLSGLARCFSVYYRRVRILDHNRTHLMGTLHARMLLVRALRNVLNQALALLDLEPVRRM